MTFVKATVWLEIDEPDENWAKENGKDFLQDALIDYAPSHTIEDNSIVEKPVFNIEKTEKRDQ